MKTLRQRALDWCQDEFDRGVRSPRFPAPNKSERVAEYLAGCVRGDKDGDGVLDADIGKWLAKAGGNWCAASQGACLNAVARPGDIIPHFWRAGVVEIVADAKAKGLYIEAADWLLGNVVPLPGDLAIWHRPGGAGWWRHVNRVREIDLASKTLVTIGGNESRSWRISTQSWSKVENLLLGFVSYPETPVVDEEPSDSHFLSDEERADLLAQIAECTAELMRGLER